MLPEQLPHIDQPSKDYCVQRLAQAFNQCFAKHQVLLKPGATEPFYQAATGNHEHSVIFSTYDYFSSALHEVAHWCIAGEERRKLDDYGYWYEPDGRNAAQQLMFYQVEAKPQALEWAFSLAAGIEFRISLDNLDNLTAPAGSFTDHSDEKLMFREKVYAALYDYFEHGFPSRAQRMIQLLTSLYRNHQPIELPKKSACLI